MSNESSSPRAISLSTPACDKFLAAYEAALTRIYGLWSDSYDCRADREVAIAGVTVDVHSRRSVVIDASVFSSGAEQKCAQVAWLEYMKDVAHHSAISDDALLRALQEAAEDRVSDTGLLPQESTIGIAQLASTVLHVTDTSAGKVVVYTDSTSTVNHGVQTRSAATSNWIRSIADDGSSTISQPARSSRRRSRRRPPRQRARSRSTATPPQRRRRSGRPTGAP